MAQPWCDWLRVCQFDCGVVATLRQLAGLLLYACMSQTSESLFHVVLTSCVVAATGCVPTGQDVDSGGGGGSGAPIDSRCHQSCCSNACTAGTTTCELDPLQVPTAAPPCLCTGATLILEGLGTLAQPGMMASAALHVRSCHTCHHDDGFADRHIFCATQHIIGWCSERHGIPMAAFVWFSG